MYYAINLTEHRELVHRGIVSTRLATYWHDLLGQLPPLLRQEAEHKSFQLVPHNIFADSGSRYAANLMFFVPDASPALRTQLGKAEFLVICLLEDR
jgi:hypothetical protein